MTLTRSLCCQSLFACLSVFPFPLPPLSCLSPLPLFYHFDPLPPPPSISFPLSPRHPFTSVFPSLPATPFLSVCPSLPSTPFYQFAPLSPRHPFLSVSPYLPSTPFLSVCPSLFPPPLSISFPLFPAIPFCQFPPLSPPPPPRIVGLFDRGYNGVGELRSSH